MSGALRDRVVVVIGGTSGLGLSAAKACIAEGAKVVCVGRNAETVATAQNSLGTNARVFAADPSNPPTAQAAIPRALEQFNRFDALSPVAGGSGRRAGDGPLHEI